METISEKAKAIAALEAEKQRLFAESNHMTRCQMVVMENAAKEVLRLSDQQGVLLKKLGKIEETMEKIINEA